MDKITDIGQDMILIREVVMDIICEVIKDIGDQITITEGDTLEIKIMIQIGVVICRDKIETEGMLEEALVTVD